MAFPQEHRVIPCDKRHRSKVKSFLDACGRVGNERVCSVIGGGSFSYFVSAHHAVECCRSPEAVADFLSKAQDYADKKLNLQGEVTVYEVMDGL